MIRASLRSEAERGFLRRVAAAPSGRGLARAAVLLARTGCPGADPDRVEAILEGLAAEILRRSRDTPSTAARARAMAEVLPASPLSAEEVGTGGTEYDDPRHSCLECVLDRKRGLPIALSLLWMEAARRAGWRMDGVGLPGHFVVRLHGDAGGGDAGGGDGGSDAGEPKNAPIHLAPFHGGEVIARPGLRRLMHSLHGRAVPLRAAMLRAMSPRELLLRLLRNLRSSFRRRGEREKAIRVAEDMLLLAPGLPEAYRDRGLLRVETGDRSGGVEDLRQYLSGTRWDGGADTVLRLLAVLTDDAELPN